MNDISDGVLATKISAQLNSEPIDATIARQREPEEESDKDRAHRLANQCQALMAREWVLVGALEEIAAGGCYCAPYVDGIRMDGLCNTCKAEGALASIDTSLMDELVGIAEVVMRLNAEEGLSPNALGGLQVLFRATLAKLGK